MPINIANLFNTGGTVPMPTNPYQAMGAQVPGAFPMQDSLPPLPAMPISSLRPPAASNMDMSQVSTDQLSPHGHIGDVLNQLIVNKQQQQNNNGMINQILSMRFQPTQEDTMAAYRQNTASLYAPNSFKGTTAQDIASNRATLELTPYTTAAKLQSSSVEAQGGATGALVSRLMAENPQMFPSVSDALYFLKGGANQGLQSTNGIIAAMPGAPAASGQMAYGKEAGKQGAELQYAAPIATAKTTASNTAEKTVQAQFDLPSITATANQSLVDMDTLISDPGLDAISGLRGMFPPIPGSPGADTLARLKQVGGQTFLNAYNQLRGGGAISDAEGNRAISAKGRLDQAQSKDAIVAALKELKSVVQTGMQVARLKASGNPGSVSPDIGLPSNAGEGTYLPPVGTSPVATHRYNPATGQIEGIQ